jgi:hypothetical protein
VMTADWLAHQSADLRFRAAGRGTEVNRSAAL